MYQGLERRASRRVYAHARVVFDLAGLVGTGKALDLCEGGLFLETSAPLTVGERIDVTIDLGADASVRAIARILRQDGERGGFALEFVEMPPATWRTIKDFVAAVPATGG